MVIIPLGYAACSEGLKKFVSWANSFPHPTPQFICGKIMVIIQIRFPKTLSVLSVISV